MLYIRNLISHYYYYLLLKVPLISIVNEANQ
jgi:hypothetical protein